MLYRHLLWVSPVCHVPRDTDIMSLSRPTGGSRIDADESAEYCVLGGAVGAAVADRLRADGHAVCRIDVTATDTNRDDPPPAALDDDALATASTVVVATRSDARNLLLAQQLRTRFDIGRVLVLVHDPPRVPSFAAAGHEPVCATTALSEAVVDAV
jgi:trk system potassium uptake protein TrkA